MKTLILIFASVILFSTNNILFSQDISILSYTNLLMSEENDVELLSLSNEGKYLVAVDNKSNLSIWNITKKSIVRGFKFDEEVMFITFLPNDNYFIIVDKTKNIQIIAVESGVVKYSFKTNAISIKAALSINGQYIAVLNDDSQIEIYDIYAEMLRGVIDVKGKVDNPLYFTFNADNSQLTLTNENGTIHTWNPMTLQYIRSLRIDGSALHGGKSRITSVSSNLPMSKSIFALEEVAIPKGGIHNNKDLVRINTISVFDYLTGFKIKDIKVNLGIESITAGPGDNCVSYSNDENNNIEVIDLNKGETIATLTVDYKPEILTISSNNKWLASAGDDGKMSIWTLDYKGATNEYEWLRSHGEPESPKDFVSKISKKWAVIIGISNYKYNDKIQTLKYADVDASSLYEQIKNFQFGGFTDSTTKLLINEKATLSEINKALKSFLSAATENDLVLIYFAGHGSPDPKNPNNLFLLCYDTDPDDMASTGFFMDDLNMIMNRFIKSKHTLVFADACHSAGISGSYFKGYIQTRDLKEDMLINRYLINLSKAKSSSIVFTASEVNETSLESELWGGGHGIFTWSVLEGLKGEADEDGDSIISLGELIEYTRSNVIKKSDGRQHPAVSSTFFSRHLPLCILNIEK